ncbi:MAG: RsmB/NOP family class I SAM-dependent RNA methyltransferase [Beijerinckiaceae bacterium]|nr:RsmB/NOP family class I SAM-dependent RNA methyltransferase [Beijerinckiaceae bacterium]
MTHPKIPRGRKPGAPAATASAPDPAMPGLVARHTASLAFERTLAARLQLDDVLDQEIAAARGLEGRDAGLVRAIAVTSFRHLGTITRAVDARVERGASSLPRPVQAILVTAAAQILFLEAADHAAVDLAVAQTKLQPQGLRFAGVVNAVLRKIGREADAIRAGITAPGDDLPPWLASSWTAHYGAEATALMAASLAEELALDITVKADAAAWAETLGAIVLPTGSLRLAARTPVHELPGYNEGGWWVQDAASAIPARLLGARPGQRVLDLCAAPGGKTAQLASTGATVTALDRSGPRLALLKANLDRLGLHATTITADATTFEHEPFDAVLLDAPCTATGTIRRHPDVAWTKTLADEAKLIALQARLLDRAADLTRPGGRLIYCTCSLQPGEGEDQVTRILALRPDLALEAIAEPEIGVPGCTTPRGEFRALPHQLHGDSPRLSGWGGFFAARFVRQPS